MSNINNKKEDVRRGICPKCWKEVVVDKGYHYGIQEFKCPKCSARLGLYGHDENADTGRAPYSHSYITTLCGGVANCPNMSILVSYDNIRSQDTGRVLVIAKKLFKKELSSSHVKGDFKINELPPLNWLKKSFNELDEQNYEEQIRDASEMLGEHKRETKTFFMELQESLLSASQSASRLLAGMDLDPIEIKNLIGCYPIVHEEVLSKEVIADYDDVLSVVDLEKLGQWAIEWRRARTIGHINSYLNQPYKVTLNKVERIITETEVHPI